jgi:serine/threonine-protein kinase
LLGSNPSGVSAMSSGATGAESSLDTRSLFPSQPQAAPLVLATPPPPLAPAQAVPGQAVPGQAVPGQAAPGQAAPGQIAPATVAHPDSGGGLARWLPTVFALVAVLIAGVIATVVILGRDVEPPRTVTITQLVPPPDSAAPPTTTTPVAPPPTTPVVTEGSVRIAAAEGSNLEGATIRLGERTLTAAEATTPMNISPGTYAVRVEREGYRPWEGEVVVTAGQQAMISPELVPVSVQQRAPAAPPATLSINTRPWSRVWIGSRELGTTPIGEATVPSGTVRLRIVDRDGRTFNRSVRVAPGATENVFFDLEGPQ